MVLPTGTFKLSGRVFDVNVGGVPDARVEVTAGSATGLWTLTRDGNYALYGVSGTNVTVTKQGYHSHLERLDVSRHLSHNVPLALIGPRWDPSGTYTMTVTAAPECRDALPEDARARTYPASIAVRSNVRYASIRFFGTQFVSMNWFFWETAGIGDNSLTLEASDYPNYGPPLVERLSPDQYFLVEGTNELAKAEVFRSSTGLEGPLDATISIGEGNNWFNASRVATCRSVNHRLTFSR